MEETEMADLGSTTSKDVLESEKSVRESLNA